MVHQNFSSMKTSGFLKRKFWLTILASALIYIFKPLQYWLLRPVFSLGCALGHGAKMFRKNCHRSKHFKMFGIFPIRMIETNQSTFHCTVQLCFMGYWNNGNVFLAH